MLPTSSLLALTILASTHADSVIQRALALLPEKPAVPVEVVDLTNATDTIREQAKRACGFVTSESTRIFITTQCPVYQRAGASPFDLLALAALIEHEAAHLKGADEAGALLVQADTVMTLARKLPAEYQTQATMYAAALRARGRKLARQ